MFGNNKYAYFVFGTAVGLCIALLFLVWSVPEFRNPGEYLNGGDQYANNHNSDTNNGKKDSKIGHWIRQFIKAEDTLAQWIMAIFTLLMTLFTGLAAWFVYGTLKQSELAASHTKSMLNEAQLATKVANNTGAVTREVGQAQIRAYLRITDLTVDFINKPADEGLSVNIQWENCGQSPAIDCNVYSAFLIVDPTYRGPIQLFERENWQKTSKPLMTISIGGEKLSKVVQNRVVETGQKLIIYHGIEYIDVFGNTVLSEHCKWGIIPEIGKSISLLTYDYHEGYRVSSKA